MTSNRVFWFVVAATLVVYGVMIFWSIPELSRDAGGLAIFDMRPGGYSFDDARAFLRALTPEGAQFYATVQHRLDAAYPALLGITLGWSILRLAPVAWGVYRYLLAATAIPGMVFDYWENSDVARMLAAGPDNITRDFVEAASFHSQLKAISSTISIFILIILLGMWAYRRWRTR